MSQIMQYSFRLFGPRKGQTVSINGHKFVGGVFNAVVSTEHAANLIKVLSFYGAYAKGTPQYDEALKREEEANGAGEVQQEVQRGAAEAVRSGAGSDGSGASSVSADNGAGAADLSSAGAGRDSAGNGHSDAGVPKFEDGSQPEPREPSSVGDEAVKKAVLKLDPENDDHWVNTGAHKGKPKLAAVEDAFGKAGLTRDDIESAIPGWTRDKALEAALEAMDA